jgi:hypothetical protein
MSNSGELDQVHDLIGDSVRQIGIHGVITDSAIDQINKSVCDHITRGIFNQIDQEIDVEVSRTMQRRP